MGVADFPIEIFKAVKKGNQPKTPTELPNSSSGASTPTFTNRSASSQFSPVATETSEPSNYFPSNSSNTSTDASNESMGRSSVSDNQSVTQTPLTGTTSLGESRGSSLKEALRGSLSKARSRSASRDRSHGRSASIDGKPSSPVSRCGSRIRTDSQTRNKQEFDPSKITIDNAIGAGKGIQRIVAAGMKSPMDFTLGIARGFHNVPKLYGDDTVRPHEKVTDFQSGLKAAGKVFTLRFILSLGNTNCLEGVWVRSV